jgi:methionine-rich copper-binding protein CopC
MRYALSLGLSLALLGSAPPALAHAELLRAMPQPGSAIPTSPSEVRLQFSEGIEGRFSGVEVAGSNGKRITPQAVPKLRGRPWWSRSPRRCRPACIG